MANVITTYTRDRGAAKANIRYIQERPGRDREKLTRPLFDHAGFIGRHEAYQFIDESAKKGRYFYRLKLSPDPAKEDGKRDLHMQKLTRSLIRSLEKRLKTAIPWAGALHDDHTDKRHVHILAALPRRLKKYELEALIREVSFRCRQQRRELDFGKERTKRQERFILSTSSRSKIIGKRPYLTAERQSQKPAFSGGGRVSASHNSCTCPNCHFLQSHDSNGNHSCVSCGRMLHNKKQELSLERKGRAWDRSL